MDDIDRANRDYEIEQALKDNLLSSYVFPKSVYQEAMILVYQSGHEAGFDEGFTEGLFDEGASE